MLEGTLCVRSGHYGAAMCVLADSDGGGSCRLACIDHCVSAGHVLTTNAHTHTRTHTHAHAHTHTHTHTHSARGYFVGSGTVGRLGFKQTQPRD